MGNMLILSDWKRGYSIVVCCCAQGAGGYFVARGAHRNHGSSGDLLAFLTRSNGHRDFLGQTRFCAKASWQHIAPTLGHLPPVVCVDVTMFPWPTVTCTRDALHTGRLKRRQRHPSRHSGDRRGFRGRRWAHVGRLCFDKPWRTRHWLYSPNQFVRA